MLKFYLYELIVIFKVLMRERERRATCAGEQLSP
jgi:hypothetical protein